MRPMRRRYEIAPAGGPRQLRDGSSPGSAVRTRVPRRSSPRWDRRWGHRTQQRPPHRGRHRNWRRSGCGPGSDRRQRTPCGGRTSADRRRPLPRPAPCRVRPRAGRYRRGSHRTQQRPPHGGGRRHRRRGRAAPGNAGRPVRPIGLPVASEAILASSSDRGCGCFPRSRDSIHLGFRGSGGARRPAGLPCPLGWGDGSGQRAFWALTTPLPSIQFPPPL